MAKGISHFGPSVRARRAEIGISLEQLSEASGISRGTLSRIENNVLNTSLANAVSIASVLGVDLSDLVERAEPLITRQGEAVRFSDEEGVSRTTVMQPPNGPELLRYELPAGTATVTFAPHPPRSVESAHIITGALIYRSGDEQYELREGDSMSIPGDRNHSMTNSFDEHCTVLLLLTGVR